MSQNDYDPAGGHTKEDADAAYDALFQELHGESPDDTYITHNSEDMVYVITARKPELDDVCAAIAYSRLKKITSKSEAYLVRVPEQIDESVRDALERLGARPPEIMSDVSGKDIILIGTSDARLAPNRVEDARILELIDRRALRGLKTAAPLVCRIEPLGAVSTLVCKLFLENGVTADDAAATLLCAGIVSATNLFTTPETTRADRALAAALANTAALDLQALLYYVGNKQ